MNLTERLEEALLTLGQILARRGHPYDLVVIGGSSLMLLGLLSRPTKDLDVVALIRDGEMVSAAPLPPELDRAQADVGRALELGEDWLNAGPTSLLDLRLPEGFEQRVETRTYGALTLRIAGRLDQICFKLYAAADQGLRSKHAADLRGLGPTQDELLQAARWTQTHDPSPGFRGLLVLTLEAFGVEDADAKL